MTKSKSKSVPCSQKKLPVGELLKTGNKKKKCGLPLKNKLLAKELEASQWKIAELTKAMQKMSSQQNKILLAKSKVAEINKLIPYIVSALVEVQGLLDIKLLNVFSTQTEPELLALHSKFPSMEAIQEVSMELDIPSPPTIVLTQTPPLFVEASLPKEIQNQLVNPPKNENKSQKLAEHQSIYRENNYEEENETLPKQSFGPSKLVSNAQKTLEYKSSQKMNLDDETELCTLSFPANLKNGPKENLKPSSSTDCKKSSSSTTYLSEGQRDSNADTIAGRLSRRCKVVKSYKEPSLWRKMRRE